MKPGETFTYRLEAEQTARGVWPYHDHSPSMMESIEGGLFGMLSILGRDEPAPDREFVVYLSSQLGFNTINGRAFVGNTPVFRAKVGDLVQWDVLAIGTTSTRSTSTATAGSGETGRRGTRRSLGPAESFRVRWRETPPGRGSTTATSRTT